MDDVFCSGLQSCKSSLILLDSLCLLALPLLLRVRKEWQKAAPQPCPGVSVPERGAGDLLALLRSCLLPA